MGDGGGASNPTSRQVSVGERSSTSSLSRLLQAPVDPGPAADL